MIETSKAFESIIERCRLALRLKYLPATVYQAEPLFEAEIRLIRKLGFENDLVQTVEFGDQLRQQKIAFHLVGSGGSSIVFFLLGISEVDPVPHHTYFQRFWLTSSGEPPMVMFVFMSPDQLDGTQISRPIGVSVHVMTGLEAIPARLEQQIANVCISRMDHATITLLQAGDSDGVYQLRSDRARWLLEQVRPTNIKELAWVTALEQIGYSHPDLVTEYLEDHQARSAFRQETGRGLQREGVWRRPILFQESIMSLLRRHAELPWDQTYRFVQSASKGRMTDQHELWKPVLEGLEQRHGANGEVLLRSLIAASRWAVCRAHHVANAITSYKAAYFRTHFREAFERTRQQMISVEQGM